MGDLRKILGDRIRTARVRLSFTQKDLAEEAGFSAPQIISQIEKGKRELKAWELVSLATVLRLEVSGLTKRLKKQFTKRFFKENLRLGQQNRITGQGLAKGGLLEQL